MSKVKVFLAGILAGAATIAAFKALPKDKQAELKSKANEAGELFRDKAYDAAYATADLVGDVTENVKGKASDLKLKSQEKYAETLDEAADHVKNLTDQASPYVDKAKDFATTYVDKAHDSIDGLRSKFGNDDIELTQDELTLEETVQDLFEDAKETAENVTSDVKETVKDSKEKVAQTVDKVSEDVSDKIDETKDAL